MIAYGASYLLGSVLSYSMLRRRLGGLQTPDLVRFLVRLLIAAAVSTGLAALVGQVLPGGGDDVSHVLAALRSLPPDQCRVIELAYFGGFTHSEIATMLDTPIGTIKGRMRLGLEKLRGQLGALAEVTT